jgi:hypothetical protein
MKKFLAAVFFGAVVLTSVSANAILIEPFIGWQTGDFELGNAATKDVDGIEFGGRLGITFVEVFNIGGEFSKGTLSDDDSPSTDYDTTDAGIFFSFEFPILVRAYATYFLSSVADPDSGQKFEGDGGFRLGIGFTGLPFVSINIEQILRKYDERGSSSVDLEIKTTMIGISVPLP